MKTLLMVKNVSPALTRQIGQWTLALGIGSLSGCAMFDPYQLSEKLSNDLEYENSSNSSSPSIAGDNDKGPFNPELLKALNAVDDQRQKWFKAISYRAQLDASVSYAALSAAVYGAYRGYLDTTSSNSSKKALAQAGVLAGGRWAVSQWVEEPGRDGAYINGYRALTCTILSVRPVALPSNYLGKRNTTSSDSSSLYGKLDSLNKKINELNTEITPHLFEKGNNPEGQVSKAVEQAITALMKSRDTLNRGYLLASQAEMAGFTLRRQAELVVADVSKQLITSRQQMDRSPSGLLAIMQDSRKLFQNLVNATEDEKKSDERKSNENNAPQPPSADNKTSPKEAELIQQFSDLLKKLGLDLDAIKENLNKVTKQHGQKAQDIETRANKALAKANVAADKLVEECKKSKGNQSGDVCNADVGSAAKANEILQKVEELYVARRSVQIPLYQFKDEHERFQNNKACSGSNSDMKLLPLGDLKLKPGEQLEIQVTGFVGIPRVTLKGSASQQLVFREGQAILQIKVADKAINNSKIQVKVTDAAGEVEEMELTVGSQ